MLKSKEPIAIVGIGCRTPGKVYGPNDLWEMLCAGIDCITTVPSERWNMDYYDPNPDKTGKIKTNRGGFIEGIDLFDNEFFNIFPKEAVDIDPQQRLLLQCTFEALEDAGEKFENCQGSRTAVYAGYFNNDYQRILLDPSNRYDITPDIIIGTHATSLANRISYFYNFKGPSITLNTACSSSLVAVHLACQDIWNQAADAAIAGGISININPLSAMALSKKNFLSPDGACKSFDESGNGYVRGEGVGLVYLKPLSKALTDQNKIYGLICGSACNSDGYTAEGFSVPSSDAQAIMLQEAYHNADIDVANVQFIEAHGTGTPKGDLAETEAFAKVFSHRPIEHPLLIGSIKSNFGHLEGAAGIVGNQTGFMLTS
ncbi:polyketide synthase [Candidatus Fukatsuia endosymbiont of Tuberolachnus salignus]|uniref:beta-ketoacyl [acyl carrier protein] synthase domain-containing protein n=1 Tax=Candidatus Fukatsuia endosymbiont of Tuberolachnus salignus TaxID=3077957 RepID=UPI00313B472A